MNASARDYNEPLFYIQPTKGLKNSLHRMGEQIMRDEKNISMSSWMQRILTALPVFSTTYCWLNMGNAHHILQESNNGTRIFAFHLLWFFFEVFRFMYVSFILLSSPHAWPYSGHKVGQHSPDSKGDDDPLQPCVDYMSRTFFSIMTKCHLNQNLCRKQKKTLLWIPTKTSSHHHFDGIK